MSRSLKLLTSWFECGSRLEMAGFLIYIQLLTEEALAVLGRRRASVVSLQLSILSMFPLTSSSSSMSIMLSAMLLPQFRCWAVMVARDLGCIDVQ